MIVIKRYLLLMLIFAMPLLAQQLNCSYCSNPIARSYISYEGKVYHENCYKNFIQLRCEKCGETIDGKFISQNGKNYHESCYNKNIALKCDLCGEIINGTYTSDFWGNNYHSSHISREVQCDYCNRFISNALTRVGSKYNDGRVICNICSENTVNSLTRAESIFNRVRISLENIGVKISHHRIDLQLVNKNELNAVSLEHGSFTDPRGFAKYTYYKSGNEIASKEFTVYILIGMPERDFEATAAHELMHVWQYESAKENLEPQLAEGSAEFISYLHMKKQRDSYSGYTVYRIENNTDPVYGDGFRRIKRIVDRKGLNFLLDHLRNSNRIPAGF